ncbi:HD domain-containing phosphohydrolase [Neobacillus niacini]|uniref:HD-GYP domain-containing protein n=1 Tax=Neobacillus niacini TaxID=86668 RepID=UPI002FFD7AFB
MILYHHERIDGKGYPKGLKGDDIHLVARIMAVADSFDAMTSNRIYREGQSKENAISEIRKNKGIRYDNDVVNVTGDHRPGTSDSDYSCWSKYEFNGRRST